MGDELLKTFGLTLRKARVESGLSQEELADLAGMDRTYVSGVERGQRNVSLKAICALAGALKLRPFQLLIDIQDHEI